MIGGLAALVGAGGAAIAMGAATPALGTTDRSAIEAIVRDYILSNPEILPEAMRNLEAREARKVVDANRARIETPFAGAWEGAARADVTLVEFFDYNCSYCRASVPVIDRLLAEDKNLKVVYRELPILGEASEDAARHSLAVAQQGNYAVFHRALYGAGPTSATVIVSAIKAARANPDEIRTRAASPEIAREIQSNLELQRTLGINGTPAWVIGGRIFAGAVGYDELKKAIAEARAR